MRLEPGKLAGAKYLVVDDNEDCRLATARVLQNAGAQVFSASNGVEAVTAAMSGDHNAVFMDLHMPVKDGYEAVAELRSRGYTKPIIALTVASSSREIQRAAYVGCDDYLCKPFELTRFLRLARMYRD